MNMALARGCWFQWEYTVQIELHTGAVEEDLAELQEIRDLYAEVANWTPQMLNAPANLADSLNDLVRWGAGSGLTNQATGAAINGVAGAFDWPPVTYLTYGTLQVPFGTWEEVQALTFTPNDTWIGQSSDGVYFRCGPTGAPVRVEAEDIQLVFGNPIVAGDADIAKARRELEAVIESKTQRSQEEQAQLQDITAALQRWFNFTTNLNERKKRDADSIAGNFH
jgi:hypothetical protein